MAEADGKGVLSGLRVLDMAHQYSGALAASLMADLGAEVVLVEHPGKGSPIRTMLPKKNGQSMWWKFVERGKKCITLSLSSKKGRELLLRLARDFDVLIENFRPGTLERWKIGPADLEAAGVNCVLLRLSGFGQTGPDSDRPGFGTVAEAMSGFAYLNGFPDGPPVFPSTTLADGVAGTFGAFGVMAAMFQKLSAKTKGVQVVDVALFEGLFRLITTQVSGYDQVGLIPERPGNFLGSHGVLRNLYRTSDGGFFVISAVGPVPIRRVLVAAGAEPLAIKVDQGAMHADQAGVEAFLEECDEHVRNWALAIPWEAVEKRLAETDVVFQRVYNVKDIVEDPHYWARGDLVRVPDGDLGEILMPGVIPKFSKNEHVIKAAGPGTGASNQEIYGEKLGMTSEEISKLHQEGVI